CLPHTPPGPKAAEKAAFGDKWSEQALPAVVANHRSSAVGHLSSVPSRSAHRARHASPSERPRSFSARLDQPLPSRALAPLLGGGAPTLPEKPAPASRDCGRPARP